ncbi:MAG TPA: ABC transporter ATP-binding protein [Kofleriaceae bacterium]
MSLLFVDNVTIARGGRVIVRERSLSVEAGEVVALVGSNGCGKSTLLTCIAGVLAPKDGRIEIDGENVWGTRTQRQRARTHLGYVPEAADPPGFLRAEELWALCAATRGSADAKQGISAEERELLGLDEIAELALDKMSLGQRRRACLGGALVGPPKLLVLDEPDNGLDVARLGALASVVTAHAKNGGATILASHDASWLDRITARRVEMIPPS